MNQMFSTNDVGIWRLALGEDRCCPVCPRAFKVFIFEKEGSSSLHEPSNSRNVRFGITYRHRCTKKTTQHYHSRQWQHQSRLSVLSLCDGATNVNYGVASSSSSNLV